MSSLRKVFIKISDDKGQGLVEFSLVVVLLFTIIMGIFDCGRLGHVYLTLSHASREGARVGVVGGGDIEITAAIRRASVSLDTDRIDIDITPSVYQRQRGASLQVSLGYDVEIITPIMNLLLPNPFPVRSVTVMRIE